MVMFKGISYEMKIFHIVCKEMFYLFKHNTRKCTISNMFDDVFDTCQKL